MIGGRIKQLSLIFGSKAKAQEIVLLLADTKPVVRQGFYATELPAVEKFCRENKLHCIRSKFKVLLADETIYSNKGIRIQEQDKRPGMYFVYLAKDEEKAWLAAYYELLQNDRDLGLLLGYPACCVDFFCRTFSANRPNPQITASNPWTNIQLRDKDVVLLSHFPCQADCRQSMELAKQYVDVLAKHDREHAMYLLEELKP